MLPTLACVKKEKTVDYVVGFDELGGSDDFSTHTLAARLSLHGLITYEGSEDYGGAPNHNQQKKKGAYVCRLHENLNPYIAMSGAAYHAESYRARQYQQPLWWC